MIIKYVFSVLISTVLSAFSMLLGWLFIAPFVKADGHLPYPLRYLFEPLDSLAIGDFADNPVRFQDREGAFTKNYPLRLRNYILCVMWACWRNPAYGFDHAIGARIPEGFKYESWGDELTTNAPIHTGLIYRKVGDYWQLYIVVQRSETKCWKLNFGWKLWGDLQAGQVRQLVCTITPFAKVVL